MLRSLFVLLAVAPLAPADDKKPLPPTHAKAAFLKLLDRPKVALDVKAGESKARSELLEERITFASEKKGDATERVPVLVIRPKLEMGDPVKRPVMILLHGTGGNKEGMRPYLDAFAKEGFVAVAIDARYHGDRADGKKGSERYVGAITDAWTAAHSGKPHEHPWFYDTCWDLWRLIDYLETRPDVDASRIGMLGISMGGIQTWLAASVDDRVAVAAPLIAVQSFRYMIDNDKWQARANTVMGAHKVAAKDLGESEVNGKVCRAMWAKLLPGIVDDYDCPNLIRLFAGRQLFIGNGELDPNCPIAGAKLAFAAAEEAFKNSKGKLVIDVSNRVAHRVTDEQKSAAIKFCVDGLKK
jgi:poly(3-hydroxybutyrate) depolymerase